MRSPFAWLALVELEGISGHYNIGSLTCVVRRTRQSVFWGKVKGNGEVPIIATGTLPIQPSRVGHASYSPSGLYTSASRCIHSVRHRSP